jgi:hypothetical protein
MCSGSNELSRSGTHRPLLFSRPGLLGPDTQIVEQWTGNFNQSTTLSNLTFLKWLTRRGKGSGATLATEMHYRIAKRLRRHTRRR